MKAGIVGIGAAGAATAMALTLRARVRELVLVNRNRARAKGVATDMRYGTPLQILVEILDRDVAPRGPLGQVVGGVQVGADCPRGVAPGEHGLREAVEKRPRGSVAETARSGVCLEE